MPFTVTIGLTKVLYY